MGGGGSYYDRDVTYGGSTTRTGYSDFAAQVTSQSNLDSSLLPLNRRLVSDCESPLVLLLDGTGSMGTLPRIFCDKVPMIAGQIAVQKYLDDAIVSLAIVGDVTCDRGPIQVCDFAKIRDLDPWLQKLWIEGGGGGQHFESYEFMAYFYARLYDMKNARIPMLIFTGDESFREELSAEKLRKHFGGQHQDVSSFTVFNELKEKFNGNVFLIHRYYGGYDLDAEITAQWQKALGRENVVRLKTDTAVGDIILGVIALASGSRTLDQYIEDIKNRPLKMGKLTFKPQSEERLSEVRKSLELFASTRTIRKESKNADETKTTSSPKAKEDRPKAGRIKKEV